MSEPLSESELHRRWERTLGDRGFADADPLATHKPAEDAGTLSGLATVGGAAATLSGGATLGGTLSGAGTVAPDGAAAGAGRGTGYELVGELGRGGMGVVFRARQRALARDIALKFIKPDQAGPATRERFISEALVNGLLDHPNIVPVHDLGTDERGEVYLAMKLVGGRSWKALLHPSTPEERAAAAACDLDRHLAILQGVGNAVAFAHSRGIVHRDLKPENVMVGEFGEVLVMDWGIAVDVRDAPDGDQRAQHKSTVAAPSGTPSYMAPELAEGRGRDIGPWTDVYLLGAILHEILTGRPPHRGRTLMEVLLAAARSAAPAWDAGVPAGLAAVAARALERDPARRFATVAEFQAAVAAWLKHRESERIADSARARLAEAGAMAAGDAGARSRRYAAFAEAVAGFRQALVLWDANAAAAADERRARLAYARAAVAGGDLGLADAQLEPLPVGGDEDLRGEVAAARTAAAARERAAARNRWLLAGAGVAIVAGLGIGFAVVSAERDATAAERDKAVAAEAEARRQEGVARSEGERARREQQAAEAARRDVSGRYAETALVEARNAFGRTDPGLAMAWQAEALARDPDGPRAIGLRMAIATGLMGRPRPIAEAGMFNSSAGMSPDEDYAVSEIQAIATTGRRDRVLGLLLHVPHMPSGPAFEAAWSTVEVWNPTATGGFLAGQGGGNLQGSVGWVVDPTGRMVLLTSITAWQLIRLGDEGAVGDPVTVPATDLDGEPQRPLAFTPDGGWLWLVQDGAIRRWSTRDLAEAPAIPLPANASWVYTSADGGTCWFGDQRTRQVLSTATWQPVPLPPEASVLSALHPVDGDYALAQVADQRWLALKRAGAGWTSAGFLSGPAVAAISRSGVSGIAVAERGRTLTWWEMGSAQVEHSRAPIIRTASGLALGPVQRDPNPRPRTDSLAGPSQTITMDERAGLAVAWTPTGAMAYDLGRMAMPAPRVRIVPAASAAALPGPAARVMDPWRDEHGRINLPDGRRVPMPLPDDLAIQPHILTAGHLVVVGPQSVEILPYPGITPGPARSIPYPAPADERPFTVGVSRDGGVVSLVQSTTASIFAYLAWTYRIDGTPILGPVVIDNDAAIPGADGRQLTTRSGTVVDLTNGATRSWRAGDPSARQIGAYPVLVRDPMALVYGGDIPSASVFARGPRDQRLRALRVGRTSDGRRSWAEVLEYDHPEAAGPGRGLSSMEFGTMNDEEPSADLSPDGCRVAILDGPGNAIALHAADDGSLLARIALVDLLPAPATFWPARVQWVDDRRILLSAGEDEHRALVELPMLDDPPELVARKVSAFTLRSVTPADVDRPAAIQAWAR